MNVSSFNPFYVKLATKWQLPFLGKVSISFFLGLLYLLPRFISKSMAHENMLSDKSFLVGIIIISAMGFLYYATHTLKQILPQMGTLLGSHITVGYMYPLIKTLSDKNFILFGCIFGLSNCFIGYSLGITDDPYSWNYYTLIWGYFLAGFVCGMTVIGMYGILILINKYSKIGELKPDYTSPDNCGGMLFIGIAILKFGFIIIIVGTLIATYILFAPWSEEIKQLTYVLRGFIKAVWIVFPFFLSFIIVSSPLSDLSKVLKRYKVNEDNIIMDKMKTIKDRLSKENMDSEDINQLRSEYEFLVEEREKLFSMRTIPLSRNLSIQLAFGNVLTLIPGAFEIKKLIT